jgi:hypothetical protein
MPNNYERNTKTLKADGYLKKILFFIAVAIFIILFFYLNLIDVFFMENVEFIILGVVSIIGSLVLFSMLGLKFPDNGNNYVNVRKIVTIEGYDNGYKLI